MKELKRKIYSELLRWKNKTVRIPLLLQGLRQTGKTTIAFAFANAEYENVFYVDFRKTKSAHAIFEGDFNIDDIVFSISALPRDKRILRGSSLVPGKTLIVLDEIQDCPNARSCLKYFAEDGRFDILCTGSLLGVNGYRRSKKPSRGIGVGSEEFLTMHPLDFEEFLWANGVEENVTKTLSSYLRSHKAIPSFFHQRFTDLFKQYLIVGGMPEAVSTFCESHDFHATRKVLRRILHDYESDFGTHLNDDLNLEVDDVERSLIGDVFSSIPRQLSKENKKFQYGVVKPNGDFRTYGHAISYLQDYGLVVKASNLSNLDNPLDWFAKDDQFKMYLCDTGLFISMLGEEIPSLILSGELGTGKGMIYENIFADAYSKKDRPLYYYRRDSGAEVDFIDSFSTEITLIEIKAKSGATKSSSALLNNPSCKAKHLIRIGSSNIGFVNNILTIPHYLCFLLGPDFCWDKEDGEK